MDNTTAEVHINRQGGMKAKLLFMKAKLMLQWAEKLWIGIKAGVTNLGIINLEGDWLNRRDLDLAEWCLRREVFWQLTRQFGMPKWTY